MSVHCLGQWALWLVLLGSTAIQLLDPHIYCKWPASVSYTPQGRWDASELNANSFVNLAFNKLGMEYGRGKPCISFSGSRIKRVESSCIQKRGGFRTSLSSSRPKRHFENIYIWLDEPGLSDADVSIVIIHDFVTLWLHSCNALCMGQYNWAAQKPLATAECEGPRV